jgi:aldehyde:ferredoxin oxidoreductase
MGSKNLKAIVARGTGSIKVANPTLFMEIVAKSLEMFKRGKSVERLQKYGTLGDLHIKQAICGIAFKNFQECVLPDEMAKAIDPRKTIERFEVARQSFPGCAIGCGRHLHITEGPYSGLQTECNQMEVMGTLQGRLAIWEPTFMMKANALCNQMGLDVDAAGGAIGWAMECFQRGILDEKDTDGLELHWGDAEIVLDLIKRISHREGFANILAEGSAKAADIVGRDSGYYAMHIKGQELYEPCRGALGWCLGTTTSTRGAAHTTGAVMDARPLFDVNEINKAKKIFGVDHPTDPLAYEGKAKMVTYMELLHRINNCLGICHMNTVHWDVEFLDLPQLAELYSVATGWEMSVEEMKWAAMRQLNLEKAFNLRHTHFGRQEDMPTPRDLHEPIPTGPLVGWKIDEKKFNQMLDEYYDLHGWDRETSFPRRGTLKDLGLENVAKDLEKMGKLR